MSAEQAYIAGFVKRASEYGYNENEAEEMLKQASRDQFIRDLVADLVERAATKFVPPRDVFAALIKKPRTAFPKYYGLTGAGLGGAAGSAIGGIHNLINPGTEVDPETGETVDRNRLKAMLAGSLKGLGIGAGIGGGIAAGAGAFIGNRKSRDNIDPAARREWRLLGVDVGKDFNKDVRPTTQPVRMWSKITNGYINP